jgi:hypothetical protein
MRVESFRFCLVSCILHKYHRGVAGFAVKGKRERERFELVVHMTSTRCFCPRLLIGEKDTARKQ